MARVDNRLLPTSNDLEDLDLFAAFEHVGITRVADEAERVALTPPAARNGVTPLELVWQLDTSQIWRWQDGTPPTLVRTYPAIEFPASPRLAGLLQSEATGEETITRSAAAIAYPGLLGRGTEIVAVDPGAGFPRYVIESITDPVSGVVTTRNISITPLRGEWSGGCLLYTSPSPRD